jgi:hypothetical protein
MSVKFFWRTTITLALGCSSTPVDVGSFTPDNQQTFEWTDEIACSSGPQLPVVGTWVGFTDFGLPPTPVRLVISHANGRHVCGTITFGPEAPPWPPLADPSAAYPPDLANQPFPSFGAYLEQLVGVPRTLTNSRVGLPHVYFDAAHAQWKDWCERQTPYPCEGTGIENQYFCIPSSGAGALSPRVSHKDGVCTTMHGGEPEVIDCGKAVLCIDGPCTCTASRCAGPAKWAEFFDIAFEGNTAAGSGVHLTRVR